MKSILFIGKYFVSVLAWAAIFYVVLNLPAFLARSAVIVPDRKEQFLPKVTAPAAKSILRIPAIRVEAPILYDRDAANEARLLTDLRSGVTHLLGTARPGEQGNAVIVGHSSNFFWEPGQYKYIFANLDKLKAGDLIYLGHQGTQYAYRVSRKVVVKPRELSALSQTSRGQLTLITCTPVGTTLRRLVVTAEQFSPDQTQNAAFIGNALVSRLPAPR